MAQLDFRYLPLEQAHGTYPLLTVTTEDKSFVCVPESPQARMFRNLHDILDYHEYVLRSVLIKGTFVGLCVFAVFFGIFIQAAFWLSSWHWAMLIGAVAIIFLLIGFDITFIVFFAFLFLLSMLAHAYALPLFIAGGIILRYLVERLYQLFA